MSNTNSKQKFKIGQTVFHEEMGRGLVVRHDNKTNKELVFFYSCDSTKLVATEDIKYLPFLPIMKKAM